MSQDVPSPRERWVAPTTSEKQRLHEIRERLKRLERELSTLPRRRAATR
jgi:hypothetical protein